MHGIAGKYAVRCCEGVPQAGPMLFILVKQQSNSKEIALFLHILVVTPFEYHHSLSFAGMATGGSQYGTLADWLRSDVFIVFMVILVLLVLVLAAVCWVWRRQRRYRQSGPQYVLTRFLLIAVLLFCCQSCTLIQWNIQYSKGKRLTSSFIWSYLGYWNRMFLVPVE